MTISIYPNAFETEADAIARLQQSNLWVLTRTEGPSQIEAHWHDFDVQLCVLNGFVQITELETSCTFVCIQGTHLVMPARTLHTETTPGTRYVMGLSADPERLEPPINRPPAALRVA